MAGLAMQDSSRAPSIIAWVASLWIALLYFFGMPFYTNWLNWVFSSMWMGICYTAGVLMVAVNDSRKGTDEWHEQMTWVGRGTQAAGCIRPLQV